LALRFRSSRRPTTLRSGSRAAFVAARLGPLARRSAFEPEQQTAMTMNGTVALSVHEHEHEHEHVHRLGHCSFRGELGLLAYALAVMDQAL